MRLSPTIAVGSILIGATLFSVSPAAASRPQTLEEARPSLPACSKPGPQKASSATPKPVTDMSTPHCIASAETSGLFFDGLAVQSSTKSATASNTVTTSTSPRSSFYKAGGRPSAARTSDTTSDTTSSSAAPSYTFEGVYNAGGGPVSGIAASLEALAPTLYGPTDTADWVGVSSNDEREFIQAGIDYQNTGDCGSGANNRPVAFAQVQTNGSYLGAYCATNYIFGVGSQTMFAVMKVGPNLWDAWINWNGVWEEIISFNTPMIPASATAEFAALEVILGITAYVSPYLPQPLDDANGQIFSQGSWGWWFETNWPTTIVNDYPYCLTFPTRFTNLHVNNQGSC